MERYLITTEGALQGGSNHQPIEVDSLTALKTETLRYLGDLIHDDGPEWFREKEAALTVTDDRGLTLFRIDLQITVAAAMPSERPAGGPA